MDDFDKCARQNEGQNPWSFTDHVKKSVSSIYIRTINFIFIDDFSLRLEPKKISVGRPRQGCQNMQEVRAVQRLLELRQL